MTCVPVVAFAPLHAPDAVQLVALLLDQVSVLDAPLATEVEFADSVSVGIGATTETVTLWLELPPVPVQFKV